MALQKPRISECIDGKAHVWMIVAEEAAQNEPSSRLEHRWCKKCGCLTQVGYGPDNQPMVAVDEDGSPHLATPKILDALIK
ncbi:hypothetical protein C4J81_02085 [Deltaproteobacteria bacterium Smac51]|nr:hypothetical protein C4J81_02085 [Deltaproteobacteria bacterium Smac51]